MSDQWYEKFIQDCRDDRDRAQTSLEFMEAGNLRLFHNYHDISERHIEQLREVIRGLDKILADYEAIKGA